MQATKMLNQIIGVKTQKTNKRKTRRGDRRREKKLSNLIALTGKQNQPINKHKKGEKVERGEKLA